MLDAMHKYGLQSVFIVTELTPPDRMRYICRFGKTGLSTLSAGLGHGVQTDMDSNVKHTLSKLHTITSKPLVRGLSAYPRRDMS